MSRSTLREALREAGLSGRFEGYSPCFRVEEFREGAWWVLDGEVKVGLIVRSCDFAELVNFDPHNPIMDIEFPAIYHAPTMPGDRVTMAKWVNAQHTTSDKNELTFSADGETARATFTEQWSNGRTASKRLTWLVDPDFGYVLHCEDEMHSPQPESHEYCNFLPKGTTDDRPEFARYPYVLWEHPSGRIVRWNQNNVSACSPGALDMRDKRRIKTGGFIGYFGEDDRNPAIELLDSVPGSTAATCPNMLDEHVQWVPVDLATYERDSSGKYVSRAAYNLVSVPPEAGELLAERAEMLDLALEELKPNLEPWSEQSGYPHDPQSPRPLAFCPLVTGKVTDFESKIDPAATFRGVVFPYLDDVDHPVSVVSDCGRSGTHSLRIKVSGKPVRATVTAGSLHVTEGCRYRLSAWIKCALDEGEAVLKAAQYLFTPSNVTALHVSEPVGGRMDWREVSLEFVPGEKAHVVGVSVEVTGQGTVWVDDILLTRL